MLVVSPYIDYYDTVFCDCYDTVFCVLVVFWHIIRFRLALTRADLDLCSAVFEYRTPLACEPKPVECAFTDDATNTAYDLSPLSRASSHWMAVRLVPNAYECYLSLWCSHCFAMIRLC